MHPRRCVGSFSTRRSARILASKKKETKNNQYCDLRIFQQADWDVLSPIVECQGVVRFAVNLQLKIRRVSEIVNETDYGAVSIIKKVAGICQSLEYEYISFGWFHQKVEA